MKGKVLLAVSLAVVLVLSLVAACAAPTPTPEEEVHVLVGGSGPGGGFYALACGLMTVINEKVPGVMATAIGSGSTANFRMMLRGEMLLSLYRLSRAEAVYSGESDLFEEAQPQVRWVAPAHGVWAFVVTLDSEIKTLQDLKGKSVAMGGPGSTDADFCEVLLNSVGLVKDVDYEGVLLDGYEAGEALIDGRVDVKYASGGQVCPSIAQVDAVKKLYFVQFPEDMSSLLAEIAKAGFAQRQGSLPKELYRGLDEDYETLVVLCGFTTYADADEELIYKITKGLWENLDMMALVHPSGAEFSLKNVKAGFELPVHPGALRYYKEIGVLTEDPFKG